MHQSSVEGVQGFGFHGSPVLTDSLGQKGNTLQESAIPHAPVELDVDDDSGSFLISRALGEQDPIEHELEALKILIAPSDQALGFIRPDLENEMSVAELLLDLDKEAKVTEESFEDFAGRLAHRSLGWGGNVDVNVQLFFVKLEPPFPFFFGAALGLMT